MSQIFIFQNFDKSNVLRLGILTWKPPILNLFTGFGFFIKYSTKGYFCGMSQGLTFAEGFCLQISSITNSYPKLYFGFVSHSLRGAHLLVLVGTFPWDFLVCSLMVSVGL